MNYNILVKNHYPASLGGPPVMRIPAARFVERCGVERLEFNLKMLWTPDVRGLPGYDADGPCVFLEWTA